MCFCIRGRKSQNNRRADVSTADQVPACGRGRTLVSIIPLLAKTSFDPEFIETLVAAYEDAWRKVEQSGSAFASPRYRRAAQEILAKRIIDMAQLGVIESQQLADDAVTYLAQSYA
jgi:hypothetical protein